MTTAVVSKEQTVPVDVDKAVAVIALAFIADPVCRWAYPDPNVYYKYFPPFIRAFAGGAFEAGTAYVTVGYEGAALWLPPGVHADEEALGAFIAETVPDELQEHLFELVEPQAATHPGGAALVPAADRRRSDQSGQRNRFEAPRTGAGGG